MRDFEDALKAALERREPPLGFASRVMARVPERRSWFDRFRAAMAMPAVASLLIATVGMGVWQYQEAERRRQEAERTTAELIYALQVTSAKLNFVRSRLQKNSERGL